METDIKAKIAQAGEYVALNDDLKNKNTNLREEVDKLRDTNKDAIVVLVTENSNLSQKIDEQSVKVEALINDNTKIGSENVSLHSQIQDLGAKIETLSNEIAILNQHKGKTNLQNLSLTSKVDKLLHEKKLLQDKNDVLQLSISEF
jgi:predicted nuclease with TOPRIM domain